MIETLILLLLAVGLAAPIGVGAGVYFRELAPRQGWVAWIGILLAGLAEASPLLAGLALWATGLPPGPASVLALALVLVPRLHRATDEALGDVDPRLRGAAEALGATRWEALRTLVLPQAIRPLLGRGVREVMRAAGEAAPLLLLGASEFLAVRALASSAVAGMLVLGVFAANVLALRMRGVP